MKSILIKDTNIDEREKIVANSIGNINGFCDECAPGIINMYQKYISGEKELSDINMEFRRGYISEVDRENMFSCGGVE